MDVDFWSSRVDLAKQLSSVQYSGHYHSAGCTVRMSSLSGESYQSDYGGSDSASEDLDGEVEAVAENLMEVLNRWNLEPPEENSNLSAPKSPISTRSLALLNTINQQVDVSHVDVSDIGSEDECGRRLSQEDSYSEEDIHLGLSDSEGDENARAFFPCPFCYVDIEVHVLCCHLQDEHCFDLKDVVCPLCSANLGKDVTGHFIAQHANSLKRRRRSHKTVVGSSTSGRTNILEISTDPLLFPFLGGVPDLESKGSQEDNSLGETSPKIHLESGDLSSSNDDVDREERRQRAAFIQELITSTIFF